MCPAQAAPPRVSQWGLYLWEHCRLSGEQKLSGVTACRVQQERPGMAAWHQLAAAVPAQEAASAAQALLCATRAGSAPAVARQLTEPPANVRAENQLIKLPANRYTVREREMLSGTAGVPSEFFSGSNGLSRILLAGGATLIGPASRCRSLPGVVALRPASPTLQRQLALSRLLSLSPPDLLSHCASANHPSSRGEGGRGGAEPGCACSGHPGGSVLLLDVPQEERR